MIEIVTPAKVNLCLDVLKRLPSGYHEIRTVFYPAYSLCDRVKISTTENPDHTSIVNNTTIHLPKMEYNLAHKALKLFKREFKIKKNAQILIDKNIPIASGLGGASSDAAAVLKGLNQLFGIGATSRALAELGEQLGADVPFFIYEKPAIGTNLGEKIEIINTSLDLNIKILPQDQWPSLPVSDLNYKTGQMYAALDMSKTGRHLKHTEALINALRTNNLEEVGTNIHNDFETLTSPAKGLHLSGSGPAIFLLP